MKNILFKKIYPFHLNIFIFINFLMEFLNLKDEKNYKAINYAFNELYK